MLPTMQALMRSNNQAMSNFQKLNGHSTVDIFRGGNPPLIPVYLETHSQVAHMYQQTMDPKCSKKYRELEGQGWKNPFLHGKQRFFESIVWFDQCFKKKLSTSGS